MRRALLLGICCVALGCDPEPNGPGPAITVDFPDALDEAAAATLRGPVIPDPMNLPLVLPNPPANHPVRLRVEVTVPNVRGLLSARVSALEGTAPGLAQDIVIPLRRLSMESDVFAGTGTVNASGPGRITLSVEVAGVTTPFDVEIAPVRAEALMPSFVRWTSPGPVHAACVQTTLPAGVPLTVAGGTLVGAATSLTLQRGACPGAQTALPSHVRFEFVGSGPVSLRGPGITTDVLVEAPVRRVLSLEPVWSEGQLPAPGAPVELRVFARDVTSGSVAVPGLELQVRAAPETPFAPALPRTAGDGSASIRFVAPLAEVSSVLLVEVSAGGARIVTELRR